MNFSGIISRLRAISQDLEFLFIFTFLVFFPSKENLFYYIIASLLILVFIIKSLFVNKNLPISSFNKGLILFNILMLVSIFFSHFVFKSLQFMADIIVISIFFILLSRHHIQMKRCFNGILIVITSFSLVNVILSFWTIHFFFTNPIPMGIVCGIGAIISFHYLQEGGEKFHVLFIIINTAGVFVSGSKAAYLGVVLFFVGMALIKNKKLLWGVIVLLLFTVLVPNPIRRMFHASIYKDPYALNRIQIWKMSLDIFGDYPVAGVGLENFSQCSKMYNFRQKRGLAQYYKIPNKTHNDFLKLLAETGLFGMIFIITFIFFLGRKALSSPKNGLSLVLLLYLLFQSLLFNILFQPLFFFLLLFLLKDIFDRKETYYHLDNFGKWGSVLILVFVFIFGNVSPVLSNIYFQKARKSDHIITVSRYLKISEFCNPFNIQTLYYRTLLLKTHFKKTAQIDAFVGALSNLKKIQRINRYFIDSYLLEIDLYRSMLKEDNTTSDFKEEILLPLRQAEYFHPKNPFIRMLKAEIYFKFGDMDQAKYAAIEALELEPDYVGAMYFLHEKFQYYSDWEALKTRILKIQKKGEKLKVDPGSYLHALFKIPG